jgi:DNA-binding SARP family transcriptional activator
LRYQLLGPLRVHRDDGSEIVLHRARLRGLLMTMAVQAPVAISGDRLAVMLSSNEPGMTLTTLRTHVVALRKALRPAEPIRTSPHGYMLTILDTELDLSSFRGLVRDGMAALRKNDHETAARLLERATSLWREPALADLPDSVELQPMRNALLEERRAAEDALVDTHLLNGQHRHLVPQLRARADADPLREHTWAQLILALYRSGHQAEASSTYHRLRMTLAEDYGTSPSVELQRLHQQILRQHDA